MKCTSNCTGIVITVRRSIPVCVTVKIALQIVWVTLRYLENPSLCSSRLQTAVAKQCDAENPKMHLGVAQRWLESCLEIQQGLCNCVDLHVTPHLERNCVNGHSDWIRDEWMCLREEGWKQTLWHKPKLSWLYWVCLAGETVVDHETRTLQGSTST